MLACRAGQPSCLRQLLQAGGDPSLALSRPRFGCEAGATALTLACAHISSDADLPAALHTNLLRCMSLLLQCGAPMVVREVVQLGSATWRHQLVCEVVRGGCWRALSRLLDGVLDPLRLSADALRSIVDGLPTALLGSGKAKPITLPAALLQPLLATAAVAGSADLLRLLVRAGCSIDAADSYGWTALMHAARARSVAGVRGCLAASAAVGALSSKLRHSFPAGSSALLITAMKPPRSPPPARSPSPAAVREEWYVLLLELLEAGSDVPPAVTVLEEHADALVARAARMGLRGALDRLTAQPRLRRRLSAATRALLVRTPSPARASSISPARSPTVVLSPPLLPPSRGLVAPSPPPPVGRHFASGPAVPTSRYLAGGRGGSSSGGSSAYGERSRIGSSELDARLLAAAAGGDVAAVKALLASGADFNAADEEGETALMKAVPYAAVLAMLLAAGADTQQCKPSGWTVVMSCAYSMAFESLQLLVKLAVRLDDALHAADSNFPAGTRAVQMSTCPRCVSLLLHHNATVSDEDRLLLPAMTLTTAVRLRLDMAVWRMVHQLGFTGEHLLVEEQAELLRSLERARLSMGGASHSPSHGVDAAAVVGGAAGGGGHLPIHTRPASLSPGIASPTLMGMRSPLSPPALSPPPLMLMRADTPAGSGSSSSSSVSSSSSIGSITSSSSSIGGSGVGGLAGLTGSGPSLLGMPPLRERTPSPGMLIFDYHAADGVSADAKLASLYLTSSSSSSSSFSPPITLASLRSLTSTPALAATPSAACRLPADSKSASCSAVSPKLRSRASTPPRRRPLRGDGGTRADAASQSRRTQVDSRLQRSAVPLPLRQSLAQAAAMAAMSLPCGRRRPAPGKRTTAVVRTAIGAPASSSCSRQAGCAQMTACAVAVRPASSASAKASPIDGCASMAASSDVAPQQQHAMSAVRADTSCVAAGTPSKSAAACSGCQARQ
eukprot:PLAT3313.15.p1 GENE.PLAT3313.15~~PLAT3313.15.p1  ORF type:complete len:1104 (+),score=522.82 PLAT3313.15:441-3314(+)